MTLARWQATIVDEEGNVLPGATVTVRRETAGAPLAALYSDRDGLVPLGNPFSADSDGFAFFFATGGAFRIDAVSGSAAHSWRYVPVGLAGESDAVTLDISYLFDDSPNDADPGAGELRLNNSTALLATQVFFDNLDDAGADVTVWLDRLDDFGGASDRGSLLIRALDGSAELIARVTGSVTDGGGYRKVPITGLAATGTFVAGTRMGVAFTPRGVDGAGNVTAPGAVAQAGNVALFANAAGTLLSDSGSLLTGKQTAYFPASSMVPTTVNGAQYAELTQGPCTLGTMNFDGTTSESVSIHFKAPKGWNESTLTFEVEWFHPLTTTNFGVSFKLSGKALSDQSNIGQAFGTEIELTDTGGVENELRVTGESAAVTLGDQSPAIMEGDSVVLLLRRDPAAAGDTMTVDAKVLGIAIYYNTSRNTDD